MHWTNPFASFLDNARAEIHKLQPEPDVSSDASLHSQFVKICEDRSFVFDIIDRAETLATAFDRMRELRESYLHLDADITKCIEDQRAGDPGRTIFRVPDELQQGMDRCYREALTLTTSAYYELSTLAGLPQSLLAPVPGSHLDYLVGVRNKILVHARRDGRIKNSKSVLTIGPILIAHLVGGESWIPFIQDWNRKELMALGVNWDDETGAEANVALLRRKKRVDDFTPAEILQLKSYMIPEPDLLQSGREMASLLQTKFLPEITRACAARVK
jgi:hypothetical protein